MANIKRFQYKGNEIRQRPFSWHLFKRLLGFLTPYKQKVTWVLVASAIGTAVRLLGPYLTSQAIDLGVMKKDLRQLLIYAAAVLAVWVIIFFVNRFRTLTVTEVGQGAIYDLRKQLFSHVQNLSFRFFDRRSDGSIFVRLNNYVNSLQDLFTNGIVSIVLNLFTLVGVTIVMLAINTKLALVSFAVVPIMIGIGTLLRKKVRRAWQLTSQSQSRMNSHLNEAINGMRITLAYGQEENNQAFFDGQSGEVRDNWFTATLFGSGFGPMVELTSQVGVLILYLVGASLILNEQLTLGSLVAYATYLNYFWEPISGLTNMYTNMLSVMADGEAVFELLDTQTTVPDAPDAYQLPEVTGTVVFKNVTFGYEPDRPVLHDFNLEVAPGETIALIGHTGAGKSTIINLLCRFYDPLEGEILVDGHPITKVTGQSLRRQVSVVLQDPFLFSGTVIENLRLGKPDATEAEVIKAAKAARAHDFIKALPEGYETEIQERGAGLSAGQRQLLAFARVFLADPQVLILDEATANIDTETERRVQQGLEEVLKNRTAFVIAHRLSTIENADRVVVMEHGRTIEVGSPQELLSKKGAYYELVQAQYGLNEGGAH